MAKLEFFVVSRSVSIDQITNQSSIFEVLEEIKTPAFPTILPECSAFSLWRREEEDKDEDLQVLIRATIPSGETHEVSANFRMQGPRHRITSRIAGLMINQPGQLRFEALLNGKHAAEHIVDVVKVDAVDAVGVAIGSASPS